MTELYKVIDMKISSTRIGNKKTVPDCACIIIMIRVRIKLFLTRNKPLLITWGQALSGLITVLEDKEYMVTLREKMNNIKKVAKFYNYDLLLAKK